MTCPIPSHPADYSLKNNIELAQTYASTHTPLEIYHWFYEMVKNKGVWDYKQIDLNKYQELGNWNYGAVGAALGIPEEVLQRAAGYAQWKAGTSDPSFGNWWGSYPYGDDPSDQEAILDGIECFKNNFPSVSPIFPGTSPFPLPDDPFTSIPWPGNPDDWFPDFGGAERTTSPLVLDLSGNGVDTTKLSQSISSGTHFNLDANGLAENTGWAGKDDGILVRDLDSDGKITSGRELFGNHTLLSKGPNAGKEAANGFDALVDLAGR